ncbi:unnamed protein product [Closterium sp. Yama58-4]|nr:unnamed protein product [Closterium sp. Yama58-4]
MHCPMGPFDILLLPLFLSPSSCLPLPFLLSFYPLPPLFLSPSSSVPSPPSLLPPSNLRNNQLTGPVLQPIPANLTVYDLDNNYLSSGFSSPPNCSQGSISFRFNCLPTPTRDFSCPTPTTPSAADAAVQSPEELCDVFCGVSAADPPCGGHGSCYVDGSSKVPTCPAKLGLSTGSCLEAAYLREVSAGAAATAAGDAGDGFAFVIAASDAATGGSSGSSDGSGGGGSLGYEGMDERSIAVEFDTARRTDANDTNNNHVGFSVRGNTSSIATSKAPFTLNDGKPKHAWIVFDPSPSSFGSSAGTGYGRSSNGGTGSLRVFLSGKASHRPGKAMVAMQVSLCEFLQPSAAEASFLMGFTASSSDSPQQHSILTWNITAASFLMGFTASSSDSPQQHSILEWNITTGDCWAYAVVGSVEMAYSILFNLSAVPLLSVSQLRDALGASCSQGNSPSQAFQYLVTLNARSKAGLAEAGAVVRGSGGKKRGSQSPLCGMPVFALLVQALGIPCGRGRAPGTSKPSGGPFRVGGFERTAFHGWFGLLLAVQRQPVVVHVQATAPSFLNYDGYADPSCFTYNLNHVVLLVGYRLTGSDPTFPHMAPPFWIIRNSWGPEWGDGGHMRMDIQGGDGVCGINTLPGIYPVVRAAKDPCSVNGTSSGVFGPLFNPCGNFTCTPTPDGASNHCDCNDPRFVEALQPDNSRTCAYSELSPVLTVSSPLCLQ